MGLEKVITGNAAVAWGIRLSRPKVIAAYPITPQTTIVEYIADFVADGDLDVQYIKVESEHSAMAACIAAENTGVRTFTATSAHGLALMHEMLHWASGARLPIVLVNVNRALGPPWSIWADHLDSIAQRDTGWMQFYAENNQEILDQMIMSYRFAENPEVMLPCMVSEDAFYLSHTVERVKIPDQEAVDAYLPPYKPRYKLDVEEPYGFGSILGPENYMEFRYKIAKAMDDARVHIRSAIREFAEAFGREYHGLVEGYRMEGAEYALVGMGTLVSTAREVVDQLRDEGHKVGLLKVRAFRPFPFQEMRTYLEGLKGVAIMEHAFSFGYNGPLFNETVGALYGAPWFAEARPLIKNYIIGIGGRDIRVKDIRDVYANLRQGAEHGSDRELEWVGLLGPQVPYPPYAPPKEAVA